MAERSSHIDDVSTESTAPSETDETAADADYYLSCNDCTFRTAVNGTVYDALDAAESHQKEYSEIPSTHFVDMQVSEYEAVRNTG